MLASNDLYFSDFADTRGIITKELRIIDNHLAPIINAPNKPGISRSYIVSEMHSHCKEGN